MCIIFHLFLVSKKESATCSSSMELNFPFTDIEKIFSALKLNHKMQEAILNPSKRGHILLYRYIISVFLIRYCQSPVLLQQFKVKDFFFAQSFKDTIIFHIMDSNCKTTVICVTKGFHNILKQYYVLYRSLFSCSENDYFLLNSRGVS